MDSLKKPVHLLIVLLIGILAFSGCTKKDNLTGNNWSDVQALTIVDTLGLNIPFSFPADTLLATSGKESKLLVGNHRNAQAKSYLRFTAFPDMADLIFENADSCYISLKILKRSPQPRSPITLKLYKTNQAWKDTLAQLDENAFTPIAGAEVQINDVPLAGLSVKIPMSFDAIRYWQCPADSVGLNMVLTTSDEGYVEVASAETTFEPTLFFKYKYAADDGYQSYEKKAAKDTYLLDAPEAAGFSPFMIDNLSPRRLYIKYDPTETLFKDMQGATLSAQQLKQLTINSAKLVLYIKDNPYYTGSTTYSLFPLNVKLAADITAPLQLATTDCERMVQTLAAFGLVDGDSLEIDITPIVQAYTSGDKTPNGIVIISQHEGQNFGYLEFWDSTTATPDNLQPYVKITYTPPYLQ